ncbi:filamentous hemagglutinin N-terminal domain-containing protein [Kamptonema sp. UHCC 0994]|uniref:two-partner secretion domain-containing protein n=1 Tax=Kamptonema sp. UHCC 0994 TaxID=3031329 RepID=UPI0023B92674|nr:filamentous hemagglutinin N-terminal domain-containing protein [Kamptonema sp. UHCC 0994]MDF0555495.1 filamentous hemagglutinin N-terminal domain-containing protein [Kamptonema sp. UHCC 0994]
MPKLQFFILFVTLLLLPTSAIAQIVPDNSLGAESSRTVPDTINNLPSDRIEGGANRGVNLFHSFREFNVGEGRGAYFANPNGILNIFTRVTGGNPSNILGTLGVQGNANLFLLNPRGIIFGPNARLDLRGSFIGSTASGILFDNGFEFSAANSNGVPLLAINIPVGLNFRENPGTIVNTSQAIGPTPTLPPLPIEIPVSNKLGLAVDPGQTLALIGGDIQLQGGNLTAYTGQILLGSVKSPGLVQFEPTALGLNLNYDNIQNFGNIEINSSLINTSGLGGGKIDIRGGNVTLNGSGIYELTLGNIDGRGIDINAQNLRVQGGSQISTPTLGDGNGSDINIRAADSVEISGIGFESYQQFLVNYRTLRTIDPFDPQIVLITGTVGTGTAGDIEIDTGRLLMRDGVVAGSVSFGAGNGGNINIRANVFDQAGSTLSSGSLLGSSGTGGNITVAVQKLTVRDGAILTTTTTSEGASGDITIKAAESVEVLRTPPGSVLQTLISAASIDPSGKGKAGDITIDTKRLIVAQGAGISVSSGATIGNSLFSNGGPGGNLTIRASESVELAGISGLLANGQYNISFLASETSGSNQGGNIYIATPVLTVRDGGVILMSSVGSGNAGSITIDADRVEVSGTAANGQLISQIDVSAGNFLGTPIPNATGNAGSINLNVGRLIVRDGAAINVRAQGIPNAGTLTVIADSIALDNKGSINGTTDSGGGGNVNLQARDIQLRRGSRITTDAGISDGGNIRINSDILATLPNENNDITANARTARGGQVTVNVPNIFGFSAVTREQARSSLGLTDAEFAALQVNPTSLLPTSDIAAISQQAGPALQGAVTFSATGVNPAQGLIALPQNVVDPTTLIAANPCLEGAGNEFTITGKGGVPPNPNDVLNSNVSQFNWVEPARGESQKVGKRAEIEIQPQAVIPAQGWVIDAQGKVTLVAYNSGGGASARSPKSTGICVPR